MAAWHVYHGKFAYPHSPDKQIPSVLYSVCLNSFPLSSCPLWLQQGNWMSRQRGKRERKKTKFAFRVIKECMGAAMEEQREWQSRGESQRMNRKQAVEKPCVIILLKKRAYAHSTAWKLGIFSIGRIWMGLSRLTDVTSAPVSELLDMWWWASFRVAAAAMHHFYSQISNKFISLKGLLRGANLHLWCCNK